MKKLASMILLIAVLFPLFSSVSSAAAVVPQLYLNGIRLDAAGAPPAIVKGTTYVPVRLIAEGMGYGVHWESSTKTVSIYDGKTSVAFAIDAETALVNGEPRALAAPAAVFNEKPYNQTSMIPLRFLGEATGMQVFYDADTKSVHISEPGMAGSAPDGGTALPPGPADGGNPAPDLPAVPDDAQALVRSIDVDGNGTTTIKFDGAIPGVKPAKLTGPARLVLDLPFTAFDPGFAGYKGADTAGERSSAGSSAPTKIRFSYYSDNPSTVRVVWDLSSDAQYSYTQGDGTIQVKVGAAAPKPGAGATPPPPAGGKVYKIVLDAGHGGDDPGAIGVTGYKEKVYNLSLVKKVKALLDKDSRFKVYLTRSNDTYVALNDRAYYANNLKADLFISFHANSLVGSKATGTETFYTRAESKRLAETLHKHLKNAIGLKDRGVKTAGYVVIKKTTMPAILLESAFLSNARDEAVLKSEAKQNETAAALVKGIKEYLKLK